MDRTRHGFLAGSGAVAAWALAGCSGSGGGGAVSPFVATPAPTVSGPLLAKASPSITLSAANSPYVLPAGPSAFDTVTFQTGGQLVAKQAATVTINTLVRP